MKPPITDKDILTDRQVDELLEEQEGLYYEIHSLSERRDQIADKLYRSGEARLRRAERMVGHDDPT